MSLGEILDRTVQIYRSRFVVLLGIAAIPAAMLLFLQFANLLWWKLTVPTLIPILGINFGNVVYAVGQYNVYLFFHLTGWTCIICAVSQMQQGRMPTVHSAVSECLSRWRSWLGITSLLWLILLFVPELLATSLFVGIGYVASEILKASESTMEALLPPLMGLFVLAGIAAAIWLGSVYLQAIPAWCVERTGIRKSSRRARHLSRGCRWKLIFARMMPFLLGLVLNVAMSSAIRYALITTVRSMHRRHFLYTPLLASSYLISAAAIAAILAPIFPIALTLLYYDQRIRKEGYDIERMMDAAGLSAPAAAAVAVVADSAEAEVQPG